ncbi:Patched family protein [Natrarchaeobius halalkaliphilus]|uniref:Patched family protein n=1 Tax=Natrarchaeobius halalkaliphilus TaxID=1679091 RepID=A0A3N6M9H3_9EURY|nr:MMPL family transporter [Natrarchaeobius halalkaliphilus]RQG90176.1 Patched family protein [Natrarchaeobius halalkaliphilus]
MRTAERIATLVTAHSRVVLVVLVLSTVLIGAGMSMVDDDSSLEQFESESPEAQAIEKIDEEFGVDDENATTSVQIITRASANETETVSDGNVLARDSLIESLEFQAEVVENESIDETLADDDPITGVENLVAITAETTQQLEEIEERGAALEEREAELNETSERLEDGIDRSIAIQREYEELAATYDESDPEYQQGAGDLEAEFDSVIEEATVGLDDDQRTEYEELAQQAREIESDRVEIERTTDDPEDVPEYAELTDALEDVYAGATMGVLEADYERLEDDADELEERQTDLEDDERASIDDQIDTLEGLDEDEFEDALDATLSDAEENQSPALAFMPSDYDPGSTTADARMTVVTQEIGDADVETGAVDDAVLETQLDLRDLAAGHDHDQIVFGVGVISDEIDRSMGDSLAIVGPIALAFVVAALLIAYRDPLDIVLGVAGIGTVLVWTFGFMGWTGIAFNQMMIAIPVLLIGLSIDYAIHVFMRYRERRERDGVQSSVRKPMGIALAGVGIALVWVTATTAIGFLANLVSPIDPIREFGVVSAFGILAALIVFGGLVPAAKVEIDSILESRGFDRHKRAFGTGGGRFSAVLASGAVAARRAPMALLLAVLLLTAGGVYGASQVDTSFDEEDFLAESPPEWTESLPGPMSPGEYQAADDLDFVNENFQRDDLQAQILIEGDVADGDVLERLASAQDDAGESHVVYTLANDEADVEGPLSVMEEVATQNESFNETFTAADTTGDDVPDENVNDVYDHLFEIDEDAASQVLHRNANGEYESARLLVAIEGDAQFDETTSELRAIASTIDSAGVGDERGLEADADAAGADADAIEDSENATTTNVDDDGVVSAIATGDPVVSYIVEQDLFETVFQSLLITLVAVFGFLTVAYRVTGNGATLGVVTLLPVAFAVSWILGTMSLIGMPFNVLTGMITSLTIGLGVAYSIHVSARYTLELERQGNVWSALQTTVTGTGGALLGSAATTVGGFGTLAFAILPVLRQFGIITALTITYAFLASVIVLPTLLILWTRYLGPDVSFDTRPVRQTTPAMGDGGTTTDGERSREPGDDRPTSPGTTGGDDE